MTTYDIKKLRQMQASLSHKKFKLLMTDATNPNYKRRISSRMRLAIDALEGQKQFLESLIWKKE